MGSSPERKGSLSFDKLVAEVSDDVFKQFLGERVAFSIWTYLEINFVEKLDVARKPKEFSDSLRVLLGSSTAQILEKLILKRLCQVLQLKLNLEEGFQFSYCMSQLRNAYVKILAAKFKPLTK